MYQVSVEQRLTSGGESFHTCAHIAKVCHERLEEEGCMLAHIRLDENALVVLRILLSQNMLTRFNVVVDVFTTIGIGKKTAKKELGGNYGEWRKREDETKDGWSLHTSTFSIVRLSLKLPGNDGRNTKLIFLRSESLEVEWKVNALPPGKPSKLELATIAVLALKLIGKAHSTWMHTIRTNDAKTPLVDQQITRCNRPALQKHT